MKKVLSTLLLFAVIATALGIVTDVQAQEPVSIVAQDDIPVEDDGSMFGDFIEIAKEHGPEGVGLAIIVLGLVYLARINGMVINGKWARVANVVLSTILSGLDPLNPNAEESLVAVIASLGSALIYELIQLGAKRLEEQKNKNSESAQPQPVRR